MHGRLSARQALLLVGWMLLTGPLWADEPAAPPSAPQESPPASAEKGAPAADQLSAEQQRVADKFRELREKLMHMADLVAATNLRQAVLLRQAVAKSNDLEIEDQFKRLIDLIKQDQLALGVKGQQEVQQNLAKILDLLLSDDRSKRLESEKARIRAYLKQINILIKEQRGLQGQTIGDVDAKDIASKQGKLADQTGELAKQIEKNEGKAEGSPADRKKNQSDKPGDKDPSDKPDKPRPEGKPQEGKSDEKPKPDKPGDKPDDKQPDKPGDKQPPKDADPKPGEKSQGKPDKSGEGKSSEEKPGTPGKQLDAPDVDPPQPGDSQPDAGDQPPPDQNPTQRRVEQARRKMKQAQEKLEQAQRNEAKDKQQEALEELAKAKAELEAILRQLREEEQGQTLKMLEARFTNMLKLENEVFEGTKRVDTVPEAQRDHDDEIEAGRLSRKQAEIVAEADKCLALLHEEPTTVAFPEAVSDMREQMQQVVVRLAQSKVGELTQGMEHDIIQALEEMIAAFKRAQKDRENKKNPRPGQAPGGEMGEPPLVDQLAEIKMIRALQMRVNQRTQRYTDMIKTEQAEKPELIGAIRQLGEREERIRRVTRDIVVGRNQ